MQQSKDAFLTYFVWWFDENAIIVSCFFALDALGFFLCVGVMFVYCAATVNYLPNFYPHTIICEDQESASLSDWPRFDCWDLVLMLGIAFKVGNYWD